MKYIDKSINPNEGTTIVNQLLADSWNGETNRYDGADYDGLKKPKYKNQFTQILLNEQNNLCCYCMKALEFAKTTLEHIIPQEVSVTNFSKYVVVDGLVIDEFINHVIHKDVFDRNTCTIPPVLYPHDIAYHNLVASCNSNKSCNHYRSDKFIKPLMYDADIENKVEYDKEGIAFSAEHDYGEELAAIGISTNHELKMYRKIWKELATEKESPDEVTDEDIELVVLTLENDEKHPNMLNNFYGKPSKKEDLKKFKWFFDYYKNLR